MKTAMNSAFVELDAVTVWDLLLHAVAVSAFLPRLTIALGLNLFGISMDPGKNAVIACCQ